MCVCGFFAAHVYECRCHLFVFRTTAAVNFAALCFVWSLLPLHSANVVFLLSVTLKPLWSTVYSHSFGTLCPSSCGSDTVTQQEALSLNFHSSLVIIWFVAVLKQLFTWAEELRQFGQMSFPVRKTELYSYLVFINWILFTFHNYTLQGTLTQTFIALPTQGRFEDT